MLPQHHSNSPAMSEERRLEFYKNQGNNLRGYAEQLAWYHHACALNPQNVCMLTIFRLLYIGADLCASVRACVSAQDEYEQRYHISIIFVVHIQYVCLIPGYILSAVAVLLPFERICQNR